MDIVKLPPLKDDKAPDPVLLDFRIKSTDKIPENIYVASVANTPKFSKGNISAFIGLAKSKKTFAMTMLASTIMGGLDYCDMIRSHNKHELLWIDTEQSPNDVQKITTRVKKMIGSETNLFMYGLRPLSPKQRVVMIEEALLKHPDIDVLIIDGARDLIMNINNPEESTEIVTKIMKWSYDFNIHIAIVIHTNSGSDKARGHIGTEIENKSETVIKITKSEDDPRYSIISEVYGRGRTFKEFNFFIDENGIPVIGKYIVNDEGVTISDDSDDHIPF